MNAKDQFTAATAHVDSAAVQPLPNSRKIYVQGSRADLQVPMREISQATTASDFGGEANPPIFVYDCSGPYSDPKAKIDIREGLPALRSQWISERGDVEAQIVHAVSCQIGSVKTTGRSHWISTTQPGPDQTECALPSGLRISEPAG